MKKEAEANLFQQLGRIEGKVDGVLTAQDLMDRRITNADKRIDDAHSRINKVAEQRGSGKVKTYGVIAAALTLATAATVGLVQILG